MTIKKLISKNINGGTSQSNEHPQKVKNIYGIYYLRIQLFVAIFHTVVIALLGSLDWIPIISVYPICYFLGQEGTQVYNKILSATGKAEPTAGARLTEQSSRPLRPRRQPAAAWVTSCRCSATGKRYSQTKVIRFLAFLPW